MTRLTALAVFTALLFCTEICAQTIQITPKAKAVSAEEVALKTYDRDTTADVLVLWDEMKVSINYNSRLSLKKTIHRTERIKILKEGGLGSVDYKFHFRSVSGKEDNLTRASATTYNMVDGKVVESRMPKNAIIRTEDGDGKFTKSFSPIDVKVGSVVEVSYDIVSDYYWTLGTFYLQRTAPVNLATLEVSTPDWLLFSKSTNGYHTIEHDSWRENLTVMTDLGQVPMDLITEKFTAVDLDAMRKEAYINNIQQYMSSVDFVVHSIRIPGNYQDLNTTWADVDKEFIDSPIYRNIHGSTQFKSEVDDIKAKDVSDMEKIEMIRTAVTSSVKWDKTFRLIPEAPAGIVKKGTGSNADINALVGAALNYAGYPTEPVLIKKRTSGILLESRPNVNTFDVFVLQTTLPDGKVMHFDPSREFFYYDLLPDNYLVPMARVISKDGCDWIDLSGKGNSQEQFTVKAILSADGRLKGTILTSHHNIAAALEKEYCDRTKEDDIIERIERRMGVTVNGMKTSEMAAWSKSCSHSIEFEKDCATAGGNIFLPAFIEKFHNRSAFKNAQRVYPVDFPCPEKLVCTQIIYLPEGYDVDNIPAPISVAFPQLAATAIMRVQKGEGNSIVINYIFKRDKTFLGVEDYAELRSFWEYLCSIYDTTLTIRKSQ